MKQAMVVAFAAALLFGSSSAWAQTAFEDVKLVPSDGEAQAEFGTGVAIDGFTAIVGAPWDLDVNGKTGSAYVFDRVGEDWQEHGKLLAADGGVLDNFGTSVALDGDTAVIGAPFHDLNGSQSGAAYVFTRIGGAWFQEAKLTASDGAADDQFGTRVAVDGDTIVAGAYGDHDHGDYTGAAYVFVRTGNVWNQQAKLTAPDGAAADGFGYAVALDGDTAVIGSPWDDDEGLQSGSLYVYDRSGGAWMLRAKLTAGDGDAWDRFGVRIGLNGDTMVVSADGDDVNGNFSGSAYIFVGGDAMWIQQAKLLPSDGVQNGSFGSSVDVDGDLAVIGADQTGTSGAAYLFVREAGVWSQEVKLLSSDAAAADYFGIDVAVGRHAVLIGAANDDDHGDESGSAYVYSRDDGDVPAVGGFGAVLTLLAVAAIGIYFVRRRAK